MESDRLDELHVLFSEDTSKRTEFSETFIMGGGKFKLFASKLPLHYKDSQSNWKRINVNITNGCVDKTVYIAHLLENEIGYSVVSKNDEKQIQVKLKSIGDSAVGYFTPKIEKNKAIWKNIAKDEDLIIEFRPYGVKVWKKLKTPESNKRISFTVIESKKPGECKISTIPYAYDNKEERVKVDLTIGEKTSRVIDGQEVEEYVLEEVVEEKKLVIDQKTRKRSWEEGVEYPLMVDADVDVKPNANNQDGYDRYFSYLGFIFQTTLFTNAVKVKHYAGGQGKEYWEAFFRFDGITIPANNTIDDATLKVYVKGYDIPVTVRAFDDADPNAPTTGGDIINHADWTTHPKAFTFDATAGYNLNSIDVKAIVEELYGSYSPYSNEAMVFSIKNTTGYYATIYPYNSGVTKCANLEINYSGGAVARVPDQLWGNFFGRN